MPVLSIRYRHCVTIIHQRSKHTPQMSDEEDGGEHTNAEYYARFWTKQIRIRYAPKRVKYKRHQKRGRTDLNRDFKSQSLAFSPVKLRPHSSTAKKISSPKRAVSCASSVAYNPAQGIHCTPTRDWTAVHPCHHTPRMSGYREVAPCSRESASASGTCD